MNIFLLIFAFSAGMVVAGCSKVNNEERARITQLSLSALADAPKKYCPDGFVFIPAGPFVMGGDYGQRHVVSTDAYCIAQHETTNEEVMTTIAQNASLQPTDVDALPHVGIYEFNGGPKKPARVVNWDEANAYCHLIGGRLPTEAEWEKAASGPHGFEYGTKSGKLNHEEANYPVHAWNIWWIDVTDICSYPTNEYGLCDMTGNVGEWVNDESVAGFCKVARGGHLCQQAGLICMFLGAGDSYLHVTDRCITSGDYSYSTVGFRCVTPPVEQH